MLETVGYDAAVAASYAPWRAADSSVGRVLRLVRGVGEVLTEDGPLRVTLGGRMLGRIAADPAETPCPGDWCVVRSWPDGPHTVERVLPRRSVVPAPELGVGSTSPVGLLPAAANVDLLVTVRDPREGGGPGLEPTPGLEVTLDDPRSVAVLRELLGTRTACLVGADVAVPGVDTLALRVADAQPDRAARPGAALVAALVGAATLPVGATDAPDGPGGAAGHRLVPLPGGGAVVDVTDPCAIVTGLPPEPDSRPLAAPPAEEVRRPW